MRALSKWFGRADPNEAMIPLYREVVEAARRPHWYLDGAVPDTVDGRFEMVAALLSLALMRIEQEPDRKQEDVWLTELFVEDMDGQLRQIGIGDYVVGKHIGKLMGALGGRLGALRDAFEGKRDFGDVLARNLYRDAPPDAAALAYVEQELRRRHELLQSAPIASVLAGDVAL